jgi:hypothetical protein
VRCDGACGVAVYARHSIRFVDRVLCGRRRPARQTPFWHGSPWVLGTDARVEQSLYQRAVGYSFKSEKVFCNKDGEVTRVPIVEHVPPDVTAQIFWLKRACQDLRGSEKRRADRAPVSSDSCQCVSASADLRLARCYGPPRGLSRSRRCELTVRPGVDALRLVRSRSRRVLLGHRGLPRVGPLFSRWVLQERGTLAWVLR